MDIPPRRGKYIRRFPMEALGVSGADGDGASPVSTATSETTPRTVLLGHHRELSEDPLALDSPSMRFFASLRMTTMP